jgi:hypothetical protein
MSTSDYKNLKRCFGIVLGHVRIIYFSEKLTSMLMVNVLCKTKNQDIPIGDGVIKQIERYCEKFAYSVLTTRWLEDIMASMREKSANSIGNTYAFVVNESCMIR